MTEMRTRGPNDDDAVATAAGCFASLEPDTLATLAHDVREGLGSFPKSLPSRWLYEGAGSELFELITKLEEYYPTRAERAILVEHATEIVLLSGASTVVELGSGMSEKTKLLLDAFYEVELLEAFVALDTAEQTLQGPLNVLADRYPKTIVSGVVADVNTDHLRLPEGTSRLLVFLGGTIGNFTTEERSRLLSRFADLLDDGEHLLLGTDLVKDPARLIAAYDDPQGVTAAFEKNVLDVVNLNLGADFDLDRFEYVARWDAQAELVDMRLRSIGTQDVTIPSLDLVVHFDDGEEIRTEVSAKFHLAGVTRELTSAGFAVVGQWRDSAGDFALTLARRTKVPARIASYSEVLVESTPASPTPSLEGYRDVRRATEALAQGLSAEDQTVQSMPDVSPTKWHLGHVTWFFEQFALIPHRPGYRAKDDGYLYLFNSYYEGAGRRHARSERGLLSRPGVVEIKAYRQSVDESMEGLIVAGSSPEVSALIELGLHHEQQHQELLLMDIKHVLGVHPLAPRYAPDRADVASARAGSLGWVTHPGGLVAIGAGAPANAQGAMDFSCGFVFDNESPRHSVWLQPFALADRLVTAGEWLEFMEDGGYERFSGWPTVGL